MCVCVCVCVCVIDQYKDSNPSAALSQSEFVKNKKSIFDSNLMEHSNGYNSPWVSSTSALICLTDE